MKGLIIKKEWLNRIFDGDKVWEIRGSNTKIRGSIQLIESGSGLIVGTCEIVSSMEITKDEFIENKDRHCIDDVNKLPYKKTYAWVLNNPRRYKVPIPYNHPQGAVIWVNL